MATFQWSAIIYGRTYSVDYRYIVAPCDFTATDREWIEPYIFTTTRISEALLNHPRWSLIRNERYCVFAVTCRAGELLGDLHSEYILDDTKTRHVYLFAGYVAHVPQNGNVILPVPNYGKLDVALFRRLYRKYVIPKWLDRNYESERLKTLHVDYEFVLDQEAVNLWRGEANALRETLATDRVYIIPESDKARQQVLWDSIVTSQDPVSICLGLARELDAVESPFLVASAPSPQERSTPKHHSSRVRVAESEIVSHAQERLGKEGKAKERGKSRTYEAEYNKDDTASNTYKTGDISKTPSGIGHIREYAEKIIESLKRGAETIRVATRKWAAIGGGKEESSELDHAASLKRWTEDRGVAQRGSADSRVGLKRKDTDEQKPEADQQKTWPEKKRENPWEI